MVGTATSVVLETGTFTDEELFNHETVELGTNQKSRSPVAIIEGEVGGVALMIITVVIVAAKKVYSRDKGRNVLRQDFASGPFTDGSPAPPDFENMPPQLI
jgi:hypothetical protein